MTPPSQSRPDPQSASDPLSPLESGEVGGERTKLTGYTEGLKAGRFTRYFTTKVSEGEGERERSEMKRRKTRSEITNLF